MGQYSQTERDGHLLIVTINRPEVYNPSSPSSAALICSARYFE